MKAKDMEKTAQQDAREAQRAEALARVAARENFVETLQNDDDTRNPALQLQPKVTAATLGGSIATVAIVVLEANGVKVTAELGAAIATISAAFLGWAARA
jgi:acyl-CoA reductase-like NAD-dependent aldehyde dehydrogenase